MRGEAASLSIDPPDEAGFKITMPQDVTDAKNRIEPEMASTLRDVNACSQLSDADKTAFAAFYQGWRAFYCGDPSGTCAAPSAPFLFGSGGQVDTADAFEAQLYAWQKKVQAAGCKQSTPPVVPQAQGQGSPADWFKWPVIGLAIGGALYVMTQTGLPRLFPKAKRR